MRSLLPLALVFLPAVATAQLSTITPGSRVRVTAPAIHNRPIVGTLMAPIGDTVSVAIQNRRARGDSAFSVDRRLIPTLDLKLLEISHGRSHWAGAKRGALVGAIGAAALGFVSVASEGSGSSEGSIQLGPAVIVIFAVLFVPPSAAVGALIGAEKWTQVYPARPR